MWMNPSQVSSGTLHMCSSLSMLNNSSVMSYQAEPVVVLRVAAGKEIFLSSATGLKFEALKFTCYLSPATAMQT